MIISYHFKPTLILNQTSFIAEFCGFCSELRTLIRFLDYLMDQLRLISKKSIIRILLNRICFQIFNCYFVKELFPINSIIGQYKSSSVKLQFKSFQMQALSHNTTIKLAIQHNISSLKVIEARYDLNQTILSVKENIQARYGSLVPYLQLQLKDTKGNLVANLDQDMKPLGFYGAQTGMVLYVNDFNLGSIHKQIQSFEGVQKYVMSQEDYQKLPQTFRKWKKDFIKNNPQIIEQNKAVPLNSSQLDPDYLHQLASSITIGSRCKLESGARGVICFVGKIVDLGNGYYVGVKLDQPYGNSNGKVKGVQYFEANDKYGIFVRPNTLQIGDFPVLDLDDQF